MCLLLFGVVLRAYDLTGQSFSFDETMDLGLARFNRWSEVWNFGVSWHIHPPFHLIVLKAWAAVFGWGEWSLRFLSVALSAATGWMTWRLARTLSLPSGAALLALVFWSLSPLSYFWARTTRSHALFAFLVLLAASYAWRLATAPSRRAGGAYAASAFLMMYTLHLGIVFFAVHGIWFALRRCRAALAAWVGAACLYLPYAPQFLEHLGTGIRNFYESTNPRDIWEAYESLLCYRFDHYEQPWISLLFVPVVALGARTLGRQCLLFLLLWLSLPAVVWVLSQSRPGFRFQYFDACLPAVWILLGCGIYSLSRKPRAVVLTLLAAVCVVVDWDQQQRFRTQDFRGAVGRIQRESTASDVVLMGNAYGYIFWAYEYYGGKRPWFALLQHPSPAQVRALFHAYPRVWVLINNDSTFYFEALIEPRIPASSWCVLKKQFHSSNQGSFQLRLYDRAGGE